jgi:hypothetical protein
MTGPAVSRRAALAGLAALGGGGWLGSARADTRPNIVIAVQQNPTLLDPFLDISNVSYRVQDNIWDCLIATDYLNDLKKARCWPRSGIAPTTARSSSRFGRA